MRSGSFSDAPSIVQKRHLPPGSILIKKDPHGKIVQTVIVISHYRERTQEKINNWCRDRVVTMVVGDPDGEDEDVVSCRDQMFVEIKWEIDLNPVWSKLR